MWLIVPLNIPIGWAWSRNILQGGQSSLSSSWIPLTRFDIISLIPWFCLSAPNLIHPSVRRTLCGWDRCSLAEATPRQSLGTRVKARPDRDHSGCSHVCHAFARKGQLLNCGTAGGGGCARCDASPSALFHILLTSLRVRVRGQPFSSGRVKPNLMNMEDHWAQRAIWLLFWKRNKRACWEGSY